MPLTLTDTGNLVTILPDGPLDHGRADELAVAVESALVEGKRNFMIHLQRVSFAESSGLVTLVSLARQVSDRGGHFILVGAPPVMQEILRATRLDRRLAVFDSTERALSQMRLEI